MWEGGPIRARPPVRAIRYPANAWNSAARTMSACELAVLQSVFARGSASCSPAYSGAPVHWLVTTSKRKWVALVSGMSNVRRINSGARGRGATEGNASAGLVKTGLKSAASAQSTAPVTAQASTRNCRSAEEQVGQSIGF